MLHGLFDHPLDGGAKLLAVLALGVAIVVLGRRVRRGVAQWRPMAPTSEPAPATAAPQAPGEHAALERRLAAALGDVDALTRANADLERFAYAAAHDLQAPLRHVANNLAWLKEDCGAGLDDQARAYLDGIEHSVERMRRLICGLLDLSQVAAGEPCLGALPLQAALDDALANLAAPIAETGARIEAATLPIVHGHHQLLVQLLQNLIGNALKFRGEVPPEIKVEAVPCAAGFEIAITDNGIGVAPAHAERIFEVFQRLHGEDRYAGAGLGLALCRRVAELHGGRIWLDRAHRGGSRFCFTLQAGKAEDPAASSAA